MVGTREAFLGIGNNCRSMVVGGEEPDPACEIPQSGSDGGPHVSLPVTASTSEPLTATAVPVTSAEGCVLSPLAAAGQTGVPAAAGALRGASTRRFSPAQESIEEPDLPEVRVGSETPAVSVSMRRCAELFSKARETSGRAGATQSFFQAISSGLVTHGDSLEKRISAFSHAKRAAIEKATEACAELQLAFGPLVHPHLFLTDMRSHAPALSDTSLSSVMNFSRDPLIVFSPTIAPLAHIAAHGDFANTMSEMGQSGAVESRETLRVTCARVVDMVQACIDAGASTCAVGGIDVEQALLENPSESQPRCAASALGERMQSPLGSLDAGRPGANGSLLVRNATVPVTGSGAAAGTGGAHELQRNIPKVMRKRDGVTQALLVGSVPDWYTGRTLSRTVSCAGYEPVVVEVPQSLRALSNVDLKYVYGSVFALVFAAGAERRRINGVRKTNVRFNSFTGPYLPAIMRVQVGDTKSIITCTGGFGPQTLKKEVVVEIRSTSVLFQRANGPPAALGVLCMLSSNDKVFDEALRISLTTLLSRSDDTARPQHNPMLRGVQRGVGKQRNMYVADARNTGAMALGSYSHGLQDNEPVQGSLSQGATAQRVQHVQHEAVEPTGALQAQQQVAVTVEGDEQKACSYASVPATGRERTGDPGSPLQFSCAVARMGRGSVTLNKCSFQGCVPRGGDRSGWTHHMCSINFRTLQVSNKTIGEDDWDEQSCFCSIQCALNAKKQS